jgi:DNA (cytosine-5)-methyltransferase 1
MGLKKLKTLDLFSGIGGFSLGLERTGGFETVSFCEIDKFCKKVLAKHWPNVPCHDDITKLTGSMVGEIDVICGGFPCQDISVAGRGAGIDGERSGLWGEYARIIRELRPRYVIVENVSALLGRGIGRVLGDLAALGYDAEWHCIRGHEIGAPQQRDRIFIAAYAHKIGTERLEPFKHLGQDGSWWAGCSEDLRKIYESPFGGCDMWPQPLVRRVDVWVSDRVDRVGSCGNSIFPKIAEAIGNAILDFKNGKTPRETNRPDA